MQGKAYVFVVCGSAIHLDTLKISYNLLRRKTILPIYIVTDNGRNEYALHAENVVDVEAPRHMDHHQASIWLKTSLHKILPSGNLYFYLDTDVLAIGNDPDAVFNEFVAPIRFAADHCRLRAFSSYAVRCGCAESFYEKFETFSRIQPKEDPYARDPGLKEERERLFALFAQNKQGFFSQLFFLLRFHLSLKKFRLSDEFYFDKKDQTWKNREGKGILKNLNIRKLARESGLYWNGFRNKLALKPKGYEYYCDHLSEAITRKFGVNVISKNWQHWNGGAFLFSGESYDFMNTWHNYTIEIFDDPYWKTRDQGTLIATAWKMGLQNQPVLDKKWNLIADYNNPLLSVNEDGAISLDAKVWDRMEFVHVYHHFGDTNWKFWQDLSAGISR